MIIYLLFIVFLRVGRVLIRKYLNLTLLSPSSVSTIRIILGFRISPSQSSLLSMANYDLTPRIAPNLDRHLVFPLLEFLQERQLYENDQILKAKIELLNKTNMVDYAMDIHKSLYHTEDVPQGTPFSLFFCICGDVCSILMATLNFLVRDGGDESGSGGQAQGAGGRRRTARFLSAERQCRAGFEGWQAV